ncbi:unnamed protein product [Periconia digitata]|uniref:Uncharacterized protein n=1 Tax=Periconia digitata TaxID=1303443 RepID=A0A9W4U572_9PLEO|nr:unnamed protein product [Periconia digitata]
MTETKKTDFSARLGVKRSKPSSTKPHTPINAPPKAATATSSKLKKEEVQRRKNPFNDMLHTRTHREKDSGRSPSSKRLEAREESSRKSEDGRHGAENIYDARAAERIADLERALALMKQEQDSLREDMLKMRENGVAYQETTEEYRRQLANTSAAISQNEFWGSPSRSGNHLNSNRPQNLPGAFQTDSRPPSRSSQSAAMDIFEEGEPSRQTRQHQDGRIDQTQDLRSQVAQLQDQLQTQELANQSKFRAEAEWQELTARLHTAEKESEERLQQLLSLKSSISSMTRMEAQYTDSELSESLSQLANRVREWVISNFRKTKINYSNLTPDVTKALEVISPDYKSINDRLALYQALIASTLMQLFREPLVVGVSESGPLAPLRHAAIVMKRNSSGYSEWRRCTVRSLEAIEGAAIQQERGRVLHRLVDSICLQLFTLTSASATPHAQQSLEHILNTAADIRRTLLLQKAEYIIHFFRNPDSHSIRFDETRMESIHDIDGPDEDGVMSLDREFGFCVFPSLEKFGDEHGDNADVNNVLLKARVCCELS